MVHSHTIAFFASSTATMRMPASTGRSRARRAADASCGHAVISQLSSTLPAVSSLEREFGAEGADDDVLEVRFGGAVEAVPAELGVEVDAVALDLLHRRDAVGFSLVALAAYVVALGVVDAETGRPIAQNCVSQPSLA